MEQNAPTIESRTTCQQGQCPFLQNHKKVVFVLAAMYAVLLVAVLTNSPSAPDTFITIKSPDPHVDARCDRVHVLHEEPIAPGVLESPPPAIGPTISPAAPAPAVQAPEVPEPSAQVAPQGIHHQP